MTVIDAWKNASGQTVQMTNSGLRLLDASGQPIQNAANATTTRTLPNGVIEVPFLAPVPYWQTDKK